MLEKYKMAGRKLYVAFVDLEKAFDCVPREVIWWTLRKKGLIEREVSAITEMYKNITTLMRIDGERLEEFEINVKVHYGSVLSLVLFAIVMDEITNDVREGGVKKLFNAYDLVLLGDSCEAVEMKYARWKKL